MMGGLHRRGSPQTPALMPQIIAEEEDPVPDFFLDDDAGVGAPMSYSSHHEQNYYQHSSDWSLKRCLFSFRSFSPTPPISDEELSSSDCESFSGCSTSPSPAPPDTDDAMVLHDQLSMSKKKSVRFHETVKILPYTPEGLKEEGELKPPQVTQPRARKIPATTASNIGIMYGLGRAGGSSPLGNSLIHLHQQGFAKIYTQKTQLQSLTSPANPYSSDEGEAGGKKKFFLQRPSQYLNQLAPQLPQPLFPPPAWRSQLANSNTQNLQQQWHRAEDRYTLGETSPTKISFNFNGSLSPVQSPPQIRSPDGVRQQESNLRESTQYNQSLLSSSLHHNHRHLSPEPRTGWHGRDRGEVGNGEDLNRVNPITSPKREHHDRRDGRHNSSGLRTVEEAPEEREHQLQQQQKQKQQQPTSRAEPGGPIGTGVTLEKKLQLHGQQQLQHYARVWNSHSRRHVNREREREKSRIVHHHRGQRTKDVYRRVR